MTSMRSASAQFLRNLWDNAGMLVVFVALFLSVSLFVPNFFTWVNMKGLALSVSMVGMVACTMLFCLASGDFDLSIEAVVACSGVLAAVVTNATGSVFVGILAGLAVGGAAGLVNGIVIARFRINALITTLATMQIVRGMGYIVSGGKAVGVTNENFFLLGNSAFPPRRFGFSIPTPVWITLACFLVFGILLRTSRFGRHTLAIGGNKEAAWLAGVPVRRIKVLIFTIQGIMAGFAGVVLASRMTSGQPKTSEGFSLEVISACVLGGVSLTGGVGTMAGVMVGVMIMGTVQNAMNLMNIDSFYQYVVRGAILLGAVLFDQFKNHKRLARRNGA
ncbi:MAG TPA: L-arabinose ABC transporter permease AraH [Candidatus Hydrogenedentes bacterium]|nr:L-arabinose ABC transporter permease AraH [Candidatus Hydrogenedentota bacterium]HPG67882.1 L-arabinose ABC transporter permease AraH [Candidatus Hydrogenedentota bacterium]